MYGPVYRHTQDYLDRAGMKSVSEQLEKQTEKFAVKTSKHDKFKHWFQPFEKSCVTTRSLKPKYTSVPARTDRFARSPIPVLTEILNAKSIKQQLQRQVPG